MSSPASSGPNVRPHRRPGNALAREASRHARFVAVMKFALPAAAVVLAAVVVTWPYLASREDAGLRLTFARQSEEANGLVTMRNARYVGTDRRSRPFTISAELATQDPEAPDRVALEGIEADITLEDGAWLALSAERGRFDREGQTLALLGTVALYSDDGYELRTEDVTVSFAERRAWGGRPITGQGPLGVIEAEGFRAEEGGRRVRFEGPVRLTLYPAAEE